MYKKLFILIIFTLFILILSGCRFFSVETYNEDPEIYEINYRGDTYYGSEEFTWRIEDNKLIGYAEGFSNKVYRSTGKDRYKFVAIWNFWNVQLRGYGTFIREDVELGPPSSQNIDIISFEEGDTEAEIKEEILRAFDAFNNNEVEGIIKSEAYEKYDIVLIERFKATHSKYNLFIYADIAYFNENYYIYIWSGTDYYIPISKEIGELINEVYN